MHIAYTNAKIKEVNKTMMELYVKRKQKPIELPRVKYDENSQNFMLLTGMPIIARIK